MANHEAFQRYVAAFPAVLGREMTDVSYEEWFVEQTGRFTERVHYKRHNPFSMLSLVVSIQAIFVLAVWFLGSTVGPLSFPAWAYDAFIVVFVAANAFSYAWSYASKRASTSGGERLREDAMYPPRDYWKAVREDDKAEVASQPPAVDLRPAPIRGDGPVGGTPPTCFSNIHLPVSEHSKDSQKSENPGV